MLVQAKPFWAPLLTAVIVMLPSCPIWGLLHGQLPNHKHVASGS